MLNHSQQDHDHSHGSFGECDHGASSTKALKFAIGLLAITLIAEVAGGLYAGSLSLLADAGHVFMDLFAMIISLVAVMLSARPASSKRTYGWHRAEILAAMTNGFLLVGLAIGLFHEAIGRLHSDSPVLAIPMLVVAVLGLIVNIVIAFKLHAHHDESLNVKSAYLHVLGDAGASVGVVVAAVIIHFTGWYKADLIITVVIGIIILIGAIRLILRAGHILLESVPEGMSLITVAKAISEIEDVNNVHDVHIWTVCSHITSLSCHINIDWQTAEDHDRIVRAVSEMLWKKFTIMHSTIQVDYKNCSDEIVGQDMKH